MPTIRISSSAGAYDVHCAFGSLRRAGSPFDGPVPPEHARPAVWVEPRLVIEVTFDRWTRAGRMRAPVYKGLRDDIDPATVTREPDIDES